MRTDANLTQKNLRHFSRNFFVISDAYSYVLSYVIFFDRDTEQDIANCTFHRLVFKAVVNTVYEILFLRFFLFFLIN